MNVLHINQADITGGAAIAAYRLHEGLLAQNVESRMLVGNQKLDNQYIATVPRRPRVENLLYRFSSSLGLNYLNYINSFDIPKHDFYQKADILNFHNLHSSFFNYLAIPKLTNAKPAVFTLHDMWSFTGHCTYSFDCHRWENGCGHCPYPSTYPMINRDNTRFEWKLKQWVYTQTDLTIVAPSQWLVQQAQKSMLSHLPIYCIPYGIDAVKYQPLESEQCRRLLDIPIDKSVLMFGAHSLTDMRKGGNLLFNALQGLPKSLQREIVLLTIGHGGEQIAQQLEMPLLNLGYISSDRLKAIAYSAADLFILPTRADNLPLVLQESMACGTPMVSFDIGGISDLVRPEITGYLARPEDAQDLGNGIEQLLADQKRRLTMRQQCRAIALAEYTLELQAQRYIHLYQKTLNS